jgi:hypothetical protein
MKLADMTCISGEAHQSLNALKTSSGSSLGELFSVPRTTRRPRFLAASPSRFYREGFLHSARRTTGLPVTFPSQLASGARPRRRPSGVPNRESDSASPRANADVDMYCVHGIPILVRVGIG